MFASVSNKGVSNREANSNWRSSKADFVIVALVSEWLSIEYPSY